MCGGVGHLRRHSTYGVSQTEGEPPHPITCRYIPEHADA